MVKTKQPKPVAPAAPKLQKADKAFFAECTKIANGPNTPSGIVDELKTFVLSNPKAKDARIDRLLEIINAAETNSQKVEFLKAHLRTV